MSGKEMIKQLQAIGFEIERIHGSHYIMRRGSDTEVVPVHKNQDLKKGLENKIKKRWGL